MQYLLDTHVILWWLTEPKKIKQKALKTISDRNNRIFISSASFWEIGIKKGLGRIIIPHNIIETLLNEGFEILSISAEAGLGVADLPMIHSDPFDRLLVIQAKLNDLIIITNDAKINDYPVVIIPA